MISAYFDESAEGSSSTGLLSVSGYVLDGAGVEGLVRKWRGMLSDFNLPYFHMSECNACSKHRKGAYAMLSDDQCDKCARQAIRIAREHQLHGHSFVLDQSEYRQILENEGFGCDPYTFMVWAAYIHVNRWVHENRSDEKISLFFESGYSSQARASELLEAVSQDEWGGKNHLASYTFVKKEESEPCQAADLIAWHVRKGYEYLRDGKRIRPDTRALIENKKTLTIEFDSKLLKKLRDDFCRKSGDLKEASRLIFSNPEE
jgi:hypothetical protein